MNIDIYGANTSFIVDHDGWPIHQRVIGEFQDMSSAARSEGIELSIVSAFRGYDKQKTIWNAKARCERPVYDDRSQPLDLSALNDRDKLLAIFRWSAIPGLSRHHWGTDIDVYDAAAVDESYEVRLLPAEYSGDGPFAKLTIWLQQNADKFGFFFPYDQDRGGVAPEPWHLSHRQVANENLASLTAESVCHLWQKNPFELSEVAIENVDMILERFVFSVGC